MKICKECGIEHERKSKYELCIRCYRNQKQKTTYKKAKQDPVRNDKILLDKRKWREKNKEKCSLYAKQRRKILKENPVKYEEFLKKINNKYRNKVGIPIDTPRLISKKGEGKTYKDSKGYICICKPNHPNKRKNNGYLYEHTFMMSEHLGRPLRKGESVHHKNGIKDDNRIENLELWSKSQPSGQRVEDKINWAIEFLKEYGYEIRK